MEIELWKHPQPGQMAMGRRQLLTLGEAARKAKALNAYVVAYVNDAGEVGYRVYRSLRNRLGTPGPMNDCEPGWGVRLMGHYRGGRWLPGRTLAEQAYLTADPATF